MLILQFDDDAYSTVRVGPRYVPKQQMGESEPPPPPKPIRTDRPEYESTAALRNRMGGGDSKPPPPMGGIGGGGGSDGGGLQELDALLNMLSDTTSK